MNKIIASKYWWLYLLIILAAVNYAASVVHYRVDLTAEKRFTLSRPTKKLLRNLNEPVTVTVFLDGDMPAGFKNLRNSAAELLQEFKEYAGSNLRVIFKRPGEGLSDSAKAAFLAYVQDSLGLKPTNVKVSAKPGESEEQRLLYPGALISGKNKDIAINFLEGQNAYGGYESLNNADALLEYKFANAIQKTTTDTVPVVGYLVGNGEPLTYNVYDLIEHTLKPNYGFGFVPIDSVNVIPPAFNAIVIVKPTRTFTDDQKLKLDQYVMHGGKIIWCIDNLYAEMDSLRRKQSDFVAFDRGLNLDDILFRYGVRINQDLVQDLQCAQIPMVVGNMGDRPQIQLEPWYYFPLLNAYSNNPISKNLDAVLSIFPNSIDTVKSPGIKKTVLLASSANSRILGTPAIVSFNSVKTEADLKTFNQSHIPVAVLLEGKFSSLYRNRLSAGMLDTLADRYKQPFLPASGNDNKMIVMSDADIPMNVVTPKEGPLPMGYDQFNQYQYANREFFLNCLEYLVNPSGILETRTKDYTLRLLDPKKTANNRLMWQLLNIGLPVLLILLFGAIYSALRKRKYEG